MDLQIDDFYKDVAAGLLALYQAFPRKIALYVEDLIGSEEPDEFGLPSPRHQSCLGALLWLAEEGFIRYDSTLRFQALDQAVLTEKAFVRLTRCVTSDDDPARPPSVQRVTGTLAYQLRQALRSGDGEAMARLGRLLFAAPEASRQL